MLIEFEGKTEPVFGIRGEAALIFPADNTWEYRAVGAGKIVDSASSGLWVEGDGLSAFPEFFETYFRENLANGAPRELFVVESYRELFYREFPRVALPTPKYCADGLVMCPKCARIFRPLSYLGIVRCNDPKCRIEMNNPLYDRELLRESIEWKRLNYMSEFGNRCYCVKTRRYYPHPPGKWELLREKIAEWLAERRRRRERELRKHHKRW